MAFPVVNNYPPFNIQQCNQMVEADDGKIWYSAGEYGSTDVWSFDPVAKTHTLVDSLGATGFAGSLAGIASDKAGTQFTAKYNSGEGPSAYRTYNDAGTAGAAITVPGSPYGNQGASFIYAGGHLVGVGGWHLAGVAIAAIDTSGTEIWTNATSNIAVTDCIGSDGLVWGRASNEKTISKIDPATGTETLVVTTSGFFSPPTFDLTRWSRCRG